MNGPLISAAHWIQRFADSVLATCGTKALCARAVWGRPDSPLSLVNVAFSTLNDLVEWLVTLYER